MSLTIVNLLQRDLGVMWKTLLGLVRKHKRLRFLRRCHGGTMLRIHCRMMDGHCKGVRGAQFDD